MRFDLIGGVASRRNERQAILEAQIQFVSISLRGAGELSEDTKCLPEWLTASLLAERATENCPAAVQNRTASANKLASV
jgi:hypothetical protein